MSTDLDSHSLSPFYSAEIIEMNPKIAHNLEAHFSRCHTSFSSTSSTARPDPRVSGLAGYVFASGLAATRGPGKITKQG